jgi:hypothetical protein
MLIGVEEINKKKDLKQPLAMERKLSLGKQILNKAHF